MKASTFSPLHEGRPAECLLHLKWMLNWRQDQRNYMLIQSFHSTDKPSDILRKIWWYSSHLDYLIIKPVLPIYGLLCTKFWIPRLEFENELDINILFSHSDLLFSLLNTNSSFPPQFLSFLHFLSSCSKPTRLHLSFVNWSVRMISQMDPYIHKSFCPIGFWHFSNKSSLEE